MGVISNNRTSLPAVQMHDEFFPADYLIESPLSTDIEDEEDEDEVEIVEQQEFKIEFSTFQILATPRRQRTRFIATRRFPYVNDLRASSKERRHWGSRKLRRFENSKLLGVHFEDEEICEDLSDMLPDTTTAFSQLFLEKDKMKAWIDFSRENEDEQEAILCGRMKKSTAALNNTFLPSCSKNQPGQPNGKFAALQDSAERRYRKIDKNLRFLLTHKPTVWGRLNEIELDLIGCFNNNPRAVFIGCLESGFDRILLHAAAQYLKLKSTSFDELMDGSRKTKIFNIRTGFSVPGQNLTAYLEQIHSNR